MTALTIPMTSCQNEDEPGMGRGREVHLTVTAARDAMTRTSMEVDDEANLICKWSAGDQLVVFANTKNAGVLTIRQGEEGKVTSVFEGTVIIPEGTEEINLIYLGSGYEGNLAEVGNRVNIDLSAQDGTFESLTEKDVLGANALIEIFDGTANATAEMGRFLASGYFNLALPDGIELAEGDVVTISSDENTIYNQFDYKLAPIGTALKEDFKGPINITKAERGNDIYITMFNCTTSLTFTVSKGGYTYTAHLGSHVWKPATYVRNSDGSAIQVTDWTKDKIAANPGDMDNWIKDDQDATYRIFDYEFMSNGVESDQNKNSYETNFRQTGADEWGGWVTNIEYGNGIRLNMLTSNGGRDFYFQWGRQMGYPTAVKSSNYYPLGINLVHMYVGYIGASGTPVPYECVFMGSTSWPMGRVNNSSLAFGKVSSMTSGPLDYSLPNTACSWEDRSGGNICPDGYRIPTAEELSIFVPSTEEVNGTYAEVKTINGVRYAVQWKAVATSGSTPATIEVKSVRTEKTSVSANDAIFNGVSPLYFRTYGYLDNEANFKDRGSVGLYWSSSNGDAGEVLSNVTGNGAKALYIEFTSSTKATVTIVGVPRSFGGCVIPIRDEAAKGIKYRPYLPWSYFIPDAFKLNK